MAYLGALTAMAASASTIASIACRKLHQPSGVIVTEKCSFPPLLKGDFKVLLQNPFSLMDKS
jgi:hypothetical protein